MAIRFEYYITGDDNDIECWEPEYWITQTFTPSISHKITSVKLLLYRDGSGALPGIITVSIKATGTVVPSVGEPVGPDLCSGTTNGDTLPTGSPYEWREITLGDGYDLEAGTKYAIVVRALTSDINNMLSWRCDFDDGAYAGGSAGYSAISGVDWSLLFNHDFMFEEWGEPPISAPSVTTDPATSVEEETAVGNGNITDNGGEDCDKRGVCWNTTGNPTVADNKSEETDPFGTGAFSRPITGLSPGTKYYVKAYAHNSAGYGYGGEESFTTKPNAPSNLVCVVQSSSQIDVNWTKGTGATKTMVRRKVGSYPSDVTDGDQAYYGTGNSFNDTSLDRATHYYYRAWSWVEGSDIWSDDYAEDNAWTLIGAPAVITNPASALSAIAATLNGTLDDDGGEACDCGFEWGLDTNYGSTTPTESKTTDEDFSQVIGGLVPNTPYHFRAFATNSEGTRYGDDETFTTALIISRAFALARREL